MIDYDNDNYHLTVNLRYETIQSADAIKAWRKILETIKGLIDSFYPQLSSIMEEYVPCIHCLRKGKYREKIYLFPYITCEELIRNGEVFIYCNKITSPSRCVLLTQLVPDLHLFDLRRIDESNLVIENVLGEGAFGTVYKATLNTKTVAVKELKTEDDSKANNVKFQLFQTEAYMMSLLHHPNIVQFYGVMLHPPRLVIQFVDGTDLFKYLHPVATQTTVESISQQSLPWCRRLKIAFHIASGLHYLQSITPPVIHRDLRSPNIFVFILQ